MTDPADAFAKAGVPGGVVVHIGADELGFLASLGKSGAYLVQAFDRDAGRVSAAREEIQGAGVYGTVSVLELGAALPYPDDTVNCVIASASQGLSLAELKRVIRPGGMLLHVENGVWHTDAKPFPDDIDDWTHFLYDAGNNPVSHDRRVAPPRSLRWVTEPLWARDHGQLGWVMVSAGGYLYTIEDEGPIAYSELPPVWKLVCRDGYNGRTIWKRDIADWFPENLYFRSGPNQLMRRLVARDDAIFVTPGLYAPVSVLDPRTGRTVRALEGTANTEEIIAGDGMLFLLINPALTNAVNEYYLPRTTGLRQIPAMKKKIAAVDPATGTITWERCDGDTANVMELSLAADAARAYYLTGSSLVCLDRKNGKTLWKADRPIAMNRPTWSVPTLMVQRDIVYVGERDEARGAEKKALSGGGAPCTITAYAAGDGRALWRCPAEDGFHSPVDIMAIGGEIWSGATASKEKGGFTVIRDAVTGAVTRERKPDSVYCGYSAGHARCHRGKATERFLITGRDGIQFIDTGGGALEALRFIRGNCGFGIMPANGLLYVPPNGCACMFYEKLPGLLALSGADSPAIPGAIPVPALATATCPERADPEPDDWPMFRHDSARGGSVDTTVPEPIGELWRAKIGGRLSAIAAAYGMVYCASVDAHTLYALDASRGTVVWRFTASARIDAPPALAKGRAYVASLDGNIYALGATDGARIWTLDASAGARLMPARGQMESERPPHGVLSHDGSIYVIAGRSPYLNGGYILYKINAETGDVVVRRVISLGGGNEKSSRETFLPDVPSADGDGLYIRQARFSLDSLEDLPGKPHLWSGTGFLDDTRYNRSYWLFSEKLEFGNPHWFIQGNTAPSGTLMCFDGGAFYCFGVRAYGPPFRNKDEDALTPNNFQLSAVGRDFKTLPWDKKVKFAAAGRRLITEDWSVPLDMDAVAMVRTKDGLFIAGPIVKGRDTPQALAGAEGIALRSVRPSDGTIVFEHKLDALPVFDGLIAAKGRLYLACVDGSVRCLGPKFEMVNCRPR